MKLPDLQQLYKEDQEAFKSHWYHLHQWSLNKSMPDMHNALFDVLTHVKTLLNDQQKDYWEATQPILYRVAMNLEIEEWRKGNRCL